MPFTSTKLD